MQRSVGAMLALSLPIAEGFSLGVSALHTPAAPARSTDAVAVAELIKPLVSPADSGKPALGDVLPDCPTTIWETDIDVEEWQAKYRAEDMPLCPVEVVATPEDNAKGLDYFIEKREEFAEMLAKHGTIWFRGFELTKDPEGFRKFWEEGLKLPRASTRSTRRACASSSRRRTRSTRRSTSRRSQSTTSACTTRPPSARRRRRARSCASSRRPCPAGVHDRRRRADLP